MAIALAADPGRERLYVSLPLQHQVGIFRTGELEKTGKILTAGFSRDLAIAPDEGWLFTGGYFNGIVEQFDLTTGRRLGQWQVGPLLRGLEWDPHRRRVYTASADGIHRIEPALGSRGKRPGE